MSLITRQPSMISRYQTVFLAGLILLASISPLWADATTDYNLAIQFYNQGRWNLAEEGCREFLKKYAGSEQEPLARLYLAQALVHQEKFGPARDEFQGFLTAFANHKERPLALYRVGECSYFLKDNERASKDLNDFLKAYPEHELAEWGWVYLGESEFRRNEIQAAATAFETYVAKYTKGALLDDAQFGLARTYEVLGKKAEAVELYRQLANRPSSPRAPESQFNLGARLYDQGEYQQAADAFLDVIRKFPQSDLVGHAEMNAGYAYYQLQDFAKAIEHFQAAQKTPADALVAGYWTGLSQKASGDLAKASQTFASLTEKNSDAPLAEAIFFHWGHTELRLGQFDKALTLFGNVYQRWPNGSLADDALYAASETAMRGGQLALAKKLNTDFESKFAESGLRFAQKVLATRLLIAEADQASGTAKTDLLEQAAKSAAAVVESSQLKDTTVAARLQWGRALSALDRPAEIPQIVSPILDDSANVHPQDLEAARLMRGHALLKTGKYTEAADDFTALLASPNVADRAGILAGLVASRIEAKQWAEVVPNLTELKQADPQDTQFSALCTRAGDLAFAAGNWTEAAQFFDLVVSVGPQSSYFLAALSGLGHTQYEQQDYPKAIATFQKVLDSNSQNRVLLSDATHLKALSLRLNNDLPGALAAYREGLKYRLPPEITAVNDEQLNLSRNAYRCAKGGARTAAELDQRPVADELYKAAYEELKRQPLTDQQDLAPLINEWATLHYKAEDFSRSDELFTLLIKEAPESELADDAGLVVAESLRFANKLPEAVTAFERLLQNPKSDEFVRERTLRHLLDLYAKMGDWQKVETTASTMQIEFPDNDDRDYAVYRLGEARLQAGDVENALKVLDQLRQDLALRTEGRPEWWPEVWLLLAETYLKQKQYANVESTLNDFRQRDPQSVLLYRTDLIQGEALENRAFWDEARAAYQKVLDAPSADLTSAEAEAQFRIAETYLKQKNYAEAFKAYYKVVVGPKFPEWQSISLFQAGICDKAQRNWMGAAVSFRQLLDQFPESDSARRAEDELKELEPYLK